MTDEDSESQVPPGIFGVPPQLETIRRRPEPLSVVALVIVAPLLLLLIIYLVRTLLL